MKTAQVFSLLAQFLHGHLDPSSPVLLALSGGPDSMALFQALLRYRTEHPLHLAVAHFDHRWREASGDEAAHLKTLVEAEGIPFFLGSSSTGLPKKNPEGIAREERRAFLLSVARKNSMQAILLAHQADDQAETVLKRIFEGAPIPRWQGISPVTLYEGIPLWRPFLSLQKKELLAFLQQECRDFFLDATNTDTRFLRSRMREEILPFLSHAFGKNIASRMHAIAEEISLLQEFTDNEAKKWSCHRLSGPLGIAWDFADSSLPPRYLFTSLLQKENTLSRPLLRQILDAFYSGKADVRFSTHTLTIIVDRHRLFLCKKGKYRWDTTVAPSPFFASTSWKEVWKGEASLALPEGRYSLRLGRPNEPVGSGRTTLGKWWTNHKVPAFLRQIVPVVVEEERVVHEFLTGKRIARKKKRG